MIDFSKLDHGLIVVAIEAVVGIVGSLALGRGLVKAAKLLADTMKEQKHEPFQPRVDRIRYTASEILAATAGADRAAQSRESLIENAWRLAEELDKKYMDALQRDIPALVSTVAATLPPQAPAPGVDVCVRCEQAIGPFDDPDTFKHICPGFPPEGGWLK